MSKQKISLCRQTRALLWKNLLVKWRVKKECLLEWSFPLALLLLQLTFISVFPELKLFPELPSQDLGSIDAFSDTHFVCAYTPLTPTTEAIMKIMATASFMKDAEVIPVEDLETLDTYSQENHSEVVGIIFKDTFSYQLKFNWAYRVPFTNEFMDHSAHCSEFQEGVFKCMISTFWNYGFIPFQASLNAAIIEVTTNHSVMKDLMSINGITMKVESFIAQHGVMYDFCIFFSVISFSPFTYFLSLHVTRERKRRKELMKLMGLKDTAFWLSWGVLYAGFVSVIATLLALLTSEIVYMTGFFTIFSLFILYGLSLIALTFLLSVLIRRPVLTGLAVFFLTLFWGCLGILVLYRKLPVSLEWILSLLSPFAFTTGIVQMIVFDNDPQGDSSLMMATFVMLLLDTVLYMALTVYFDKLLPGDYGHRHSPLFFLKSSFWSPIPRSGRVVFENENNPIHSSDNSFEPVSPEFHGKEAIRIKNIKKEYKKKSETVEALQGFQLDIYEGQITAILGHSGAGKSTLLNILCGLLDPSEGSATIYNYSVTERTDVEEIRKITGVCPQFSVHLDSLTVKENLSLFAKIKGILPEEMEQEIQRVLMELEMKAIQDTRGSSLSDGQKRKLTFAIAILGDPQVLLLDEPTCGLDPRSRLRVWDLLKSRKSDRVILLCTHRMDEADVLADRKVFISNGKLKCAGSSLFLKKKWGIGYHLSLRVNETCNSERITSLVQRHIPDAKLAGKNEEKLVYILPLERTDKFPALYSELDSCTDQGIVNYGVSMTTLNEVFLKLEGKTAVDEAGPGILGQEPGGGGKPSEPEQATPRLPEMKRDFLSGLALWRQQFRTMARIRFLKLKCEKRPLRSLFFLLVISFSPLILEHLLLKIFLQPRVWPLNPGLYFLSSGQKPHAHLTPLLILNNTDSPIEDLIHSLERQNIVLDVDDFASKNGTYDPSHNGAIVVSRQEMDYRFSAVCHTKRLNCFPVLINIISNALLGILNSTEQIQIQRGYFAERDFYMGFESFESSFFWIFMAASISPYIGMSSIGDYKLKIRSRLHFSGLFPSAYWCGQAAVDMPLNMFILICMSAPNYFLALNSLMLPTVIICTVVAGIISCTASMVAFMYVVSFMSRKRSSNDFWCLCFFVISIFSFMLFVQFNFSLFLMLPCIILVPFCTLIGCTILFFHPCLQCLLFLFILRCLEAKKGKKMMKRDPIFRISPRINSAYPSLEEPEGEDDDVSAERARTADALDSSNAQEKPVIIASCLCKEYEGKKRNCFSKRKKKVASRNVSFCVKQGEVLGLLGHSGAGKSTLLRMIVGETTPSAGKVILKQNELVSGSLRGDEERRFPAYCPQEEALWPDFTVREHLEVYAAVKGMTKEDATASITRISEILKLQEHLKVPVKKLSVGIIRKLCFALSMLGNPTVVLLDEPSTGMDPKGQQQIWQMIRATCKSKEKGAILSTHNMAEAEAVCDRVAIVVAGQLRFIGSIQHLKSKFGSDYVLEMKAREPGQMEPLHAEILRLFPQAARQERYSSLMVYKLPMTDVCPLSAAFMKLEEVKQGFDLENYSLSQCTFEQVFLELTREQDLECLDEELDLTVKWKLLPSEDP
ncbi:ATP-binding cassette sub-family A member 9-like [Tachyglossus aculeatus]|uniref:ATP-binding cassette sub-family A member 9-like n=1 Tax=Tachyglossus aculeatus TaxID=9261 RepID=UPI0018F2BD96|nr:ATP-binding cassette sub-family A member 9-like [Tachyglossus aculeatus]XP_038612934.1 ATP-binding cassette sub-family A member 9-like [Tachyglossus aculeatus]